jgi:hypothetical protein
MSLGNDKFQQYVDREYPRWRLPARKLAHKFWVAGYKEGRRAAQMEASQDNSRLRN